MERATRDRLTGAVILVAIAAILVPEMLSGPGDDAASKADTEALADTGPPLTTYEMSLNSSAPSRTVRPAQVEPEEVAGLPPPVVVEAPAVEPAAPPAPAPEPAQPKPAPDRQVAQAAPAPTPAPKPAQPAARPAPAPTPAAPAASSPSRPATATATAPKPAAAAPAAQGSWWVQVGSFSSDANANKLAGELRAKGFAVQVSKVRSNNRDMFAVRAGPARDRTAANDLRSRLAAAGQQGFVVSP